MKVTNEHNLHLAMSVFLMHDDYDYDHRNNHISVTKLLDSTRQIILSKRADNSATEMDVGDLMASSLGTAVHDAIENAWSHGNYANAMKKLGYSDNVIDRVYVNPDPEWVTTQNKIRTYPIIPIYIEQRKEKEIDGYIISGKYDFVGDGELTDHKTSAVYGYMAQSNEDKFMKQGSIYRWLNQDIITADHMTINYLFTDWSKLQAMIQMKKGYPQFRSIQHKIQLLSIEDTEAYIRSKIAQIKQYITADECDLPLCTAEELWSSKTQWKYFKNPQGKRATKNYDNYAEAQTHLIKDGSVGVVKEVKGKVKRCEYCNGFAAGCMQARQLILDGLLDLEA